MVPSRRIFAIVPAAGLSRRMGQPKLLLPWKDSTIIEHVLAAWAESEVTRIIVVLRSADAAIHEVCQKWPLDVVRPEVDPADMKESVQHGLRHVANSYRPTSSDQWMVAPADVPRLDAQLINRLVTAGATTQKDCIVAPRFGGRQGHPVLFPWSLTPEVFALPRDQGIDGILARRRLKFVDLPAASRVADVDTPSDYQKMRQDP